MMAGGDERLRKQDGSTGRTAVFILDTDQSGCQADGSSDNLAESDGLSLFVEWSFPVG